MVCFKYLLTVEDRNSRRQKTHFPPISTNFYQKSIQISVKNDRFNSEFAILNLKFVYQMFFKFKTWIHVSVIAKIVDYFFATSWHMLLAA